MRIFVKAKPSAKKEEIVQVDDANFVVSVKEPPVKGLANMAIIRALADFFDCPKENIKIISGYTSRQKVIEIVQD